MNLKFKIILPVKNGGSYVKECIKSILSQNYQEFELLVLENCSSDGTTEWLNSLTDPRIQVLPSYRPLSIEYNWQRILNHVNNEYITIIGHDDLLEENYLSIMHDLIISNPQATLYQCHFKFIDRNGSIIRDCLKMSFIEQPKDFLKSILTNNIDVNGTGYMMRAEDYIKVGGMHNYPDLLFADFDLWVKLTSLGHKVTSPLNGFSYRIHQSTSALSSDEISIIALGKFVTFLNSYIKGPSEQVIVLRKYLNKYLLNWCTKFSVKLIKKPITERNYTVQELVKRILSFNQKTESKTRFQYLFNFKLVSALIIDSNTVSRTLFLLFKKVFPHPVIK